MLTIKNKKKELAKMTPKGWGEDLPFIENATKAIDVVVKGANETKRVNDKMLKVLDLQNKLDRDAAVLIFFLFFIILFYLLFYLLFY